MATIGEIAAMFHLPVSTLRYYDQEGLFPHMERKSGIRQFGEREIETLRMIECLKASGLEIREIRQFIQWTTKGSATYPQRKQLFEVRKKVVEQEIDRLKKIHSMLQYKCWYYETALQDGSEDRIRAMLPDHLPPEIQKLYDFGRSRPSDVTQETPAEGEA